MKSLRPILIADDNPADVELMTAALRTMKIANEIIVAHDGEEALACLRARTASAGGVDLPPAVLLLDLKMPRVDGFAVLRALRADPAWQRLPVVVLTSSREERDIIASYDSGTNAFVVKPVDFREFIATVGQLGCFWATINETVESLS
jgi:CheY-like chemotaxis protein